MTDLDIPPFLLREAESPPKRRRQRTAKQKWVMAQPPYAKHPPKITAFKDAHRVTLSLGDECPRIGSGQRTVWAKRARKWAHLCDSSGHRAKLPIGTYDRLVKR